jgi:hypothetical protein
MRYVTVLTTIEDRAQIFLSESTQHLEVIEPDSSARVSLDWDAQKWKAPRDAKDDEAFRALLRGAKFGAVSVLIAKTVGPTVERAAAGIFFTASTRIVASMWPQVIGAVAGTAVEPGVGSLAGWAIGITGGVAFDYYSNRYREHLDRPAFEKATSEALEATMQEWSRAIQRDVFRTIDVWFDDTRAIVAEHKIQRR